MTPSNKSSTLDQWEAESKDWIKNGDQPNDIYDLHKSRIDLIALIRKKDEALKFYAEKPKFKIGGEDIGITGERAKEALALTEQLK